MLSLPAAIHRKSCFLRSMHTVSLDWISQSRQLHMLHLVPQNIPYEQPKLGANWIKGELGTNQPIYKTEADIENRLVLVMENGEGEGWIGSLDWSVSQFFCSIVSDSLRPHESQHARPPCPSPTPGVQWNSRPSSHWCHPAISSLSSPSPLPSIFPSIRVFSNESALRIRWPKYWSFSFNISPSNEHSFRMDWWTSLQSKGLSRVFSNTTVQKHQFFGTQLSL